MRGGCGNHPASPDAPKVSHLAGFDPRLGRTWFPALPSITPQGITLIFVLSLLPALVPALILALLVGNPVREHPRRAVLLAMPPLAFGMITAALLIRCPLPEATAPIIVGAVLSALPFFAAGFFANQG